MDAQTARKYRRLGQVPSELAAAPRWRTRPDPFLEVWEEIRELLEVNAGLEAKTVFEYLQRRYPGRFGDGQVRTLQRRVKNWRATEGPGKEVFFAQQHPVWSKNSCGAPVAR
jgi:putative component of toxin-antitoxin plasmid stabilization module